MPQTAKGAILGVIEMGRWQNGQNFRNPNGTVEFCPERLETKIH